MQLKYIKRIKSLFFFIAIKINILYYSSYSYLKGGYHYMDDYKVKIHFNDQGNTLEEIILKNFIIYLDINNDIYE